MESLVWEEVGLRCPWCIRRQNDDALGAEGGRVTASVVQDGGGKGTASSVKCEEHFKLAYRAPFMRQRCLKQLVC